MLSGGVPVIAVAELKRWLNTLSPTDEVGIDEGGLTLVSYDEPDVYMAVGGYVGEGAEESECCSQRDPCWHTLCNRLA